MPLLEPSSLPTEIKRRRAESDHPEFAAGIGLDITWSTGEKVFFDSRLLRTNCPCAECLETRGKINHSKPFSEPPKRRGLTVIKADIEQETNLAAVWAVGNYALGIRWADRHDAGIYSYGLLRELASRVP